MVRPAAFRPGEQPAADDPLAPLLDLPGVAERVGAAQGAVDRLLAHPVLRRQSAQVSAESSLRGARASAALDGVEVPLSVLRVDPGDDPVVQGALRVAAGLGSFVDTWQRAPLQVLARLHVLAAADLAGPDQLGRPSGRAGVSARLEALARLVAGGSRAPAVVVAAVVHAELLAVRPFGLADGLVARAAGRLTLVGRGLDPKSLSVPEVGHLERSDEYRGSLSGYVSGRPNGVAGWLRHCSAAVAGGAREGLAVCESIRRG